MAEIPKFSLYGSGNSEIEESLQPTLGLRSWTELGAQEKQTALQDIRNKRWIEEYSSEVLSTIEYLNRTYLRICPGKHLHSLKPNVDFRGIEGNHSERLRAANVDFQHIFLTEESEAMVMRMLSKFLQEHINGYAYGRAQRETDPEKREGAINEAFQSFDNLANCLNHIFEQFSVNQLVTRNGFTPRQDEQITKEVYVPTLNALSDPKWKPVNSDLAGMFEDYRNHDYPETITKAHSAVQRFLQILVGEEGKNGRGEVGKLFAEARQSGAIPKNRFTEPMLTMIQSYISSERATNSTAKPSVKDATDNDARLMMNLVLVLLQYCLQTNSK